MPRLCPTLLTFSLLCWPAHGNNLPSQGREPALQAVVSVVGTPQLIIGKWEGSAGNQDVKGMIEFVRDGTIKIEITTPQGANILSASGKYRFTDDRTVEVEVTLPGDTKAQKEKVTITGISTEEMSTMDARGKVEKLKRVK